MINRSKDDKVIYRMYIGDECVYIGVTNNIKNRMSQHEQTKDWFDVVDKIEATEYMNINMAYIYEIYYISRLNPRYNTDYKSGINDFSLIMKDIDFKEIEFHKATKRGVQVGSYLKRLCNKGTMITNDMKREFCINLNLSKGKNYSKEDRKNLKHIYTGINGINKALENKGMNYMISQIITTKRKYISDQNQTKTTCWIVVRVT